MSNYSDHSTVSQIRYTAPNLTEGITYNPQGLWTPKIDAENIAYHSLDKPFNLSQYLYPRPPIDMGLIEKDEYNCDVNVLRMPLKFPGTNYRIPRELGGVTPLITRVAEYEAFINPRHADFFATSLTITVMSKRASTIVIQVFMAMVYKAPNLLQKLR